MQFVAEAVLHIQQLARKHGRPLKPRIGVAFGSVCLSIASAISESSFLAAGQVITLAAAVAQATPPGTIAFVQSAALKALGSDAPTTPLELVLPNGNRTTVLSPVGSSLRPSRCNPSLIAAASLTYSPPRCF